MADQNDRPKVGPADPETRRKLLQQKLNEPTGATGTVKRTPPAKPKKKRSGFQEVKDALDPTVSRERRVGEKGETMSDAIERGIRESKDSKED